MGEELSKPRDEAWLGDLVTLLSALRWLERRAGGVLGRRRLGGTPWFLLGQRHFVERAPLGRVGIIATWNYPVQLVGIQIAQALVAGNRVVVKPSERSPRTQGLLLDLAEEALAAVGGPSDAVERVGAAREAGERMLREDRFDHVVFTGSTGVGRSIARSLAGSLTASTLELSGRDSAIVLADADAELAARCVWEGVRTNGGQTCMAPRRVLVVGEGASERFERAIGRLAAGASVRALADDAAGERVLGLAREAASRGGGLVPAIGADEGGARVRPRVVTGVGAGDEVAGGDHFGPLVAVVRCADEAEALAVHRSVGQHLAASVFTRSAARGARLGRELGASQVTVNDVLVPTAHPGASLGGRGASGWGDSRGAAGLLAMTREVHVSVTGRLRLPAGPVDDRVLGRMVGFVRWWYGGRRGTRGGAERGGAGDGRGVGAGVRSETVSRGVGVAEGVR
jgi:aldehyde dehydrogenase (NAD+)